MSRKAAWASHVTKSKGIPVCGAGFCGTFYNRDNTDCNEGNQIDHRSEIVNAGVGSNISVYPLRFVRSWSNRSVECRVRPRYSRGG